MTPGYFKLQGNELQNTNIVLYLSGSFLEDQRILLCSGFFEHALTRPRLRRSRHLNKAAPAAAVCVCFATTAML